MHLNDARQIDRVVAENMKLRAEVERLRELLRAEMWRAREAGSKAERLREALERIVPWWTGSAEGWSWTGTDWPWRPDITALAALENIAPSEAHRRISERAKAASDITALTPDE